MAGVAAAAAVHPPMYAAANPQAQDLLRGINALDSEICALHKCQLFDDKLLAQVMGLPTASGFHVLRAIDDLKNVAADESHAMAGVTAAVAGLKAQVVKLVRLRLSLDC